MKEGTPRPALIVFTGRFGSGKTETALNYAVALAQDSAPGIEGRPHAGHSGSGKVILIDLDIVTPYFRSREMADSLQSDNVQVIAPSVIGQHLDTPAITPQILGAIQQLDRPVVLDVGGDRQGARALGQFSTAIRQHGYTMYFVVNPYRPFTDTLEGLSRSIAETETSARLQVHGLVSNPNLIGETTIERIVDGHATIEKLAQELGLPIAFVCMEQKWAGAIGPNYFAQPVFMLDRHFVMSWE